MTTSAQTFKVINLGCKVNRAESDLVELLLSDRGHIASQSDCDIVVVNTCTVTSTAEKKTRKAVRRALSENPHAQVIVTGCAGAQSPDVYEGMSERVSVVMKWDLDRFLKNIESSEIGYMPRDDMRTHNAGMLGNVDYCRANVKVQDGCRNSCTYCIIHDLRGPERSVDVDQVLERVRQLASRGVAEVILSGINLGRYDFHGILLDGLCEKLLNDVQGCRFRLSSIEPDNLSDEVIELVASSEGRICRHFHLPLQSGCDKILSAMGRNYTTGYFENVARRIRRRIPNASISTDVICGFPGESEADFEETMAFCERMGFSKMHVFPFSPREGTPAFDMEGQIPLSVKGERAKRLRGVSAELRARDLERRMGKRELAVVEDAKWCMTESYHRVSAPHAAPIGSLVEIQIDPKMLQSSEL